LQSIRVAKFAKADNFRMSLPQNIKHIIPPKNITTNMPLPKFQPLAKLWLPRNRKILDKKKRMQ